MRPTFKNEVMKIYLDFLKLIETVSNREEGVQGVELLH